jgi:hypothetical protein
MFDEAVQNPLDLRFCDVFFLAKLEESKVLTVVVKRWKQQAEFQEQMKMKQSTEHWKQIRLKHQQALDETEPEPFATRKRYMEFIVA